MVWTVSQAPPEIEPGTVACAFRAITDGPNRVAPHRHTDLHQLTWAPGEVLLARLGDVAWTVPPGFAVWVPAGRDHALQGRERGVPCIDFKVHRRLSPEARPEPALIAVTPLLASLLEHLAAPGLTTVERRRAELVLFDQLRPVHRPGLEVGLPSDPRARTVADALLDDPADDRDLADWARLAGTSARTLDRIVRDGTGAGFRTWRIRISVALGHIAAGSTVAAAARRVGYRQASTFSEVFRQTLGSPPRQYIAQFAHPAAGTAAMVWRADAG